jgi:hypothetical protein
MYFSYKGGAGHLIFLNTRLEEEMKINFFFLFYFKFIQKINYFNFIIYELKEKSNAI